MAKLKTVHSTLCISSKVLCDCAVSPGTTVSGNLYRWVLIHKLRPAIVRKQPQILEEGPILLHDGAGPLRAASVVQLLAECYWEVLGHPPYSPDLSPCALHLFPVLKEPMRGQRFVSVDDINEAVSAQLKNHSEERLGK